VDLQKEIGHAIRGELPGNDPACKDMTIEGTVDVDDLRSFRIGANGIVFDYQYKIPPAGRACEPTGQFFLPFATLGPFLLRNGPLSRLIEGSQAPSRSQRRH
jgi:hypothetical protein